MRSQSSNASGLKVAAQDRAARAFQRDFRRASQPRVVSCEQERWELEEAQARLARAETDLKSAQAAYEAAQDKLFDLESLGDDQGFTGGDARRAALRDFPLRSYDEMQERSPGNLAASGRPANPPLRRLLIFGGKVI